MLYHLSYQANWELVITWVDDKSIDDGYIHVFELWVEMNSQHMMLTVSIYFNPQFKYMGHIMWKGPGQHDTPFQVICIWKLRQNKSKMAEALRYVHSRSDFYGFNCYFRTFITSIMLFGEWSGQKCLKLKMDKICHPGPFRMTQPTWISCVNTI